MQKPKYTVSPELLKAMAARLRTAQPAKVEESAYEYTDEKAQAFFSPREKEFLFPKSEDFSSPSNDSSSHRTNGEDGSANERLGTDRFGKVIEYNDKQLEAIKLGGTGQDCIIVGAAGTGKTTVTKAVIAELIHNGKAGVLGNTSGHKYLQAGTPGIVCVSFTRRAVTNLRRNMSADMANNCMTIHKLLEYAPVKYDVIDPETGKERTIMRFEPQRNAIRPLPGSLRVIIFDESSMVSVELYNLVMQACSHKMQIIFLGDIQQLPPTFGSAILGYKMLELPTVELTQVYRQALESPIIRLAHRILSGKPLPGKEYPEWHFPNQLKLHPWAKKISDENACIVYAGALCQRIEAGAYDPIEDMVLCPFNKSFGTIELNKHIAQYLARKADRDVYEVIAGFNKHYFSVGEKVLYDREDAVITGIVRNGNYSGVSPQVESPTLSYWGIDSGHAPAHGEDDTDFLLQQLAAKATGDVEERTAQASHRLTIELLDTGDTVEIDTAAEINALLMGYALTVHKAQGSEWRRVFLALHQSHAMMTSRELLYTAVTRAKEELHVVCEPETFTKGILSQRIKGNTLKEKAEFFKGKLEEGDGKLFAGNGGK
jgi:exodeoxyribonuclease V alpha subunit